MSENRQKLDLFSNFSRGKSTSIFSGQVRMIKILPASFCRAAQFTFSRTEMKLFFLAYIFQNIFASSHDYCQEDEWMGDDCEMYKKCIFDPDGLNVRRTVFCVSGSKVTVGDGFGMSRKCKFPLKILKSPVVITTNRRRSHSCLTLG